MAVVLLTAVTTISTVMNTMIITAIEHNSGVFRILNVLKLKAHHDALIALAITVSIS